VRYPAIIRALDPRRAIDLILLDPGRGFVLLGAVVLAVTGAEALYADMGHFGPAPIRRAWPRFVFPALLLNYFGQGALLLAHPDAIENPFFRLAPDWGVYPLVGLASAATVIASQAVISGAFSITRQAVQLGYLPRMQVRHTSHPVCSPLCDRSTGMEVYEVAACPLSDYWQQHGLHAAPWQGTGQCPLAPAQGLFGDIRLRSYS